MKYLLTDGKVANRDQQSKKIYGAFDGYDTGDYEASTKLKQVLLGNEPVDEEMKGNFEDKLETEPSALKALNILSGFLEEFATK